MYLEHGGKAQDIAEGLDVELLLAEADEAAAVLGLLQALARREGAEPLSKLQHGLRSVFPTWMPHAHTRGIQDRQRNVGRRTWRLALWMVSRWEWRRSCASASWMWVRET